VPEIEQATDHVGARNDRVFLVILVLAVRIRTALDEALATAGPECGRRMRSDRLAQSV